MDRRQSAARRQAVRRPARLRVATEHGDARLYGVQPLLLRAAGQAGGDHRRALQPGRHGGRLHRQRARSKAHGLLRAARWQTVAVADSRHLRAEGDDHQ